jgi:hypothetical protein
MIRPSIRVAAAIAGALVLVAGLSVIADDFRDGTAMLIGSIFLFAPAFMPPIDAVSASRFRIAAMICFTFAGLTWIAVMMMRNRDVANSVAALGVASWLAGFVLTPIAVYYHSRARMRGLWPT